VCKDESTLELPAQELPPVDSWNGTSGVCEISGMIIVFLKYSGFGDDDDIGLGESGPIQPPSPSQVNAVVKPSTILRNSNQSGGDIKFVVSCLISIL
jgi:hypothetical protein